MESKDTGTNPFPKSYPKCRLVCNNFLQNVLNYRLFSILISTLNIFRKGYPIIFLIYYIIFKYIFQIIYSKLFFELWMQSRILLLTELEQNNFFK